MRLENLLRGVWQNRLVTLLAGEGCRIMEENTRAIDVHTRVTVKEGRAGSLKGIIIACTSKAKGPCIACSIP